MLDGLDKTARTRVENFQDSSFAGFHPFDFDRCVVRDIQDKDGSNIFTLKIKIKEMKLEDEMLQLSGNESDGSDDSDGIEYPGIIWGNGKGLFTVKEKRIDNCLFVVYFCKNRMGKYFYCVDKTNDSNDSFNTFPKIQPKSHYSVYRIKVKVINMKPSQAVIAEKIAKRYK